MGGGGMGQLDHGKKFTLTIDFYGEIDSEKAKLFNRDLKDLINHYRGMVVWPPLEPSTTYVFDPITVTPDEQNCADPVVAKKDRPLVLPNQTVPDDYKSCRSRVIRSLWTWFRGT